MKTKRAPRSPDGPDYSGRRVLVTGGLGFIGSTLARRILALGAKVRVLDSLLPQSGGTLRNVADVQRDMEILVEDVRDRDMVYRAVEGCDLVFHLAGPSAPGTVSTDWYSELDVACLGTLHVLDAVRVLAPTARVVFASSHHVYARDVRSPVKESAPTDPTTLFGAHKLAAEKYCVVYGRSHSLDTVIARISSVFGPRQRVRGAPQDTLAHVLDALLHGEDPRVGASAREDLMYVDDAADALAVLGTLKKARGLVLNVGSGTTVALRDAAAEIARVMSGRKSLGRRAPAIGGFRMDVGSLKRLGIAPGRRDLGRALAETVAWFRGTHGAS